MAVEADLQFGKQNYTVLSYQCRRNTLSRTYQEALRTLQSKFLFITKVAHPYVHVLSPTQFAECIKLDLYIP